MGASFFLKFRLILDFCKVFLHSRLRLFFIISIIIVVSTSLFIFICPCLCYIVSFDYQSLCWMLWFFTLQPDYIFLRKDLPPSLWFLNFKGSLIKRIKFCKISTTDWGTHEVLCAWNENGTGQDYLYIRMGPCLTNSTHGSTSAHPLCTTIHGILNPHNNH